MNQSELNALLDFIDGVRASLAKERDEREVDALLTTISRVSHLLDAAAKRRAVRGFLSGERGSEWELKYDPDPGVLLVDYRTTDRATREMYGSALYYLPGCAVFVQHCRIGRSGLTGEDSYFEDDVIVLSALDVIREYNVDEILAGLKKAVVIGANNTREW